MTQQATQSGAKVLLCGVRIPPNLGPVYGARFLKIYRETADKYRVPLVPYILKGVSDNEALMQKDGIHPNTKGQPVVLENVWKKLVSLL